MGLVEGGTLNMTMSESYRILWKDAQEKLAGYMKSGAYLPSVCKRMEDDCMYYFEKYLEYADKEVDDEASNPRES